MKKIFSAILCLVLVLTSFTSFAANFSDVAGHWAESYIIELTNENVINGYPDGTYKPEGILTYGEFIKLIVTASFSENVYFGIINTDYTHWAGVYAQVLVNYDIISSEKVTDAVLDLPIPRIEVVRILSECDIKIRENAQKTAVLEFTDIDTITSMEKTLLRHAVATGIINGDPEGTFRPNDNLKRGETAKIIYIYKGF